MYIVRGREYQKHVDAVRAAKAASTIFPAYMRYGKDVIWYWRGAWYWRGRYCGRRFWSIFRKGVQGNV